MKDRYTIHEIAELYGVGADSLRYYEKIGLIHPKRGPNGYRLYRLTELYRITIIRDLLSLGFNTAQIKDYLDTLRLDNTLTMLEDEQRLVEQRRQELLETERSLKIRTSVLTYYRNLPVGEVALKSLPPRPCVRLNTDIRRDEEFDFAIKKLHRIHDDTIRDLGSRTMGASMSPLDLEKGDWGLFRSVFFVLPPEDPSYDFLLPGGDYAVLLYRGGYDENCRPSTEHLQRWVREQGLTAEGEILELYHIDNRYTAREEEFVTELQLRFTGSEKA